MEAQGDPFRRGLPTLQTSLTLPELPPCPRHLRSENLFRFSRVAGTWGKFLVWTGGAFFQSAAIAPDWRGARNDMRGIALKCGVGGIDPCVVPIREMLLANLFLRERRFIPPHQSPTAPASPKGKPFCKSLFVLHDKAISESIYTRPHPSPAATNCLQSSPPKGKPFARVFSATRQGDKRKHLHTSSSLSCGDKPLAVFSP